jgi:hypothetical protein
MNLLEPSRSQQAVYCPPRETEFEQLPTCDNAVLGTRQGGDRPLLRTTRAVFATYIVVKAARARHRTNVGADACADLHANVTKLGGVG